MSEKSPISADSARSLVDQGATLVDVRSLAGRTTSGEIEGAQFVDKQEVAAFAEGRDADEPIVVFCGTTAGSGPVVDWLDEHGFTNVQHVEGGFTALAESGFERKATP